ncbi:MAG: hypothetical protein RLZZ612_1732, partial [Pseudomonadota bacterium]
ISQAVFEHLQYPEAAAAEIWRILKPDGVAKIDTAFLQPEHAYPHHYFNATEAGLRHWFRDFELQWSGVEDYQHPKWALLWFLDVYLAALPPAAQEKVWPIDLANCVAVLKRLQTGQVDTDADLEISLALDELAPESVRALAAGVSVKAVKRTAMSGISRQKGVFNSGVQLELERRLQAQAERAKEGGEYQRAIAELKTIADDRTRFLAHEYELNRQDPLVNPGLVRPLIRLLVREIRHRLPASWEFALRRHYRQWIQTKPQRADVSEMMPRAALTFWSCPKTPVGLLDQFFSLVRQTHGDWVYLLQTSSDHSPAMKRLMWELERRDRRVYILSEQNVKTDLLGVASVHLPSDAVLTFDAVHELCTLLQHHPHASCITADLEKWFHIDQYPIRCWGQEYLHISPTEVGLRLLNSRPIKATAVATSIPLKTYAHIPKVLYRLMPFAQA